MMICIGRNCIRFSYAPPNRKFQTNTQNLKNIPSASRQVKILQKLLGNRESGSKKRWYPHEQSTQSQITSVRDIGKAQNKQGKNASRRVNVLNKLFMKHITDQLASGSLSEQVLGKGLEISRVKMSPDFNGINVFWIARGGAHSDAEIETTFHKCSGILRHELSQLRLMGEVPRINFVKDRSYANLADVDQLLKECDFGEEYEGSNSSSDQIREELGFNKLDDNEDDIPPMRHDVFGLNHKEIMTGILTKMRKSKDAWINYEMDSKDETSIKPEMSANSTTAKLDALRSKLNEAKIKEANFEKFLNSRNFKEAKPERKKPIRVLEERRQSDEYEEYSWRGSRDEEDYIEENENKK